MKKEIYDEMERLIIEKIKTAISPITSVSSSSMNVKASMAAKNLMDTLWYMKDLVDIEEEDK